MQSDRGFRLKQKNVIASRSESVVVTNSFLECLKYVVMKHNADVVLCEKLIRHHLLPLLEWCLMDNQACYKTVFNQSAALVQYWCRNQHETKNYPLYLKHFWCSAESLFQGLLSNLELKNDPSSLNELAAKQVEFLQSLKHMAKPKKQLKVKFTTEDTEELPDTEQANSPIGCDTDYFDSLNKLALKTCEAYIRLIEHKRFKALIEQLYNIFSDFCDTDVFAQLRKQFGGNQESANLSGIYWNVLYKWLKCSYLCCKPLVDLVFLLIKSLDEEEKTAVLNSLKEVTNSVMFCMLF